MKKSIFDKKMLNNKEGEEGKLCIPKNFHIYLKDNKFQLLNLNKKRKNGEFYKNNKFNEEFRRKMNVDENIFKNMKDSYFMILKSCNNNRKKMVKMLKRSKLKFLQAGIM